MEKSNLKLVTHDASFHTDDIFAAATLSIYLENLGKSFEIIRTRDKKEIEQADIVFDVGEVYDESKNRFDHHQAGGAGKREDKDGEEGIEYASFGLVWKKFGEEVAGSKRAAEIINEKLVAPIDAWDNARDIVTNKYKNVSPYYIQNIFFSMEPTWREEDKNIDDAFLKCVEIAKTVLKREIVQIRDILFAEEKVTALYNETEDKRMVILDKGYPFGFTLHNFPEPIYVIYPRKTNNWWGAKAIRGDLKSFNNRKDFPKTWGGLREEELQKVTGVKDAVFCHRGLFLCVAKSKEGAIKLAQIALANKE